MVGLENCQKLSYKQISHQQMVNARDIAGNAKETKKKILLYAMLSLIKVTGIWESKNFYTSYLTKFLIYLDGKQKLLYQLSHKVLNLFEWNMACSWDLLILSASLSFNLIWTIFSRETLFMWFCQRNFNVGLHSDIYRLISFKLGMRIKRIKLHILITVLKTLTFIQGHTCADFVTDF